MEIRTSCLVEERGNRQLVKLAEPGLNRMEFVYCVTSDFPKLMEEEFRVVEEEEGCRVMSFVSRGIRSVGTLNIPS